MSDDPIRWRDAVEPPEGALELVRSLEGPPPLPPDLRARTRARVQRATAPRARWVGPTALAVAAAIGGLVIWTFAGPTERPVAPLPPDVEAILDEGLSDPTSVAPAGEAPAEADETTPAPTETIHEAGTAGVDGTPADETTTEATTEPPRERARRRTEPVQVTAAPRPAPSPLQADPVRYGFLTINTMPWSRVFVDGELIGNTPIRRHRVTAGVHEIVLDSPEAGRHTLRVDVAPAEDLRIVRQLAPRGSHRVSPF